MGPVRSAFILLVFVLTVSAAAAFVLIQDGSAESQGYVQQIQPSLNDWSCDDLDAAATSWLNKISTSRIIGTNSDFANIASAYMLAMRQKGCS